MIDIINNDENYNTIENMENNDEDEEDYNDEKEEKEDYEEDEEEGERVYVHGPNWKTCMRKRRNKRKRRMNEILRKLIVKWINE